MDKINVAGIEISKSEATALVKMLLKDAEQVAGVFHGMNRSRKFRANWPDEYRFVRANWKSFVEPTRKMYAARLGDPKTPPEEARKMHLALVLQVMMAQGEETDNRLQITPGTQQFEGDRSENRKISEKFGEAPNLRAALLNSVASRDTVH